MSIQTITVQQLKIILNNFQIKDTDTIDILTDDSEVNHLVVISNKSIWLEIPLLKDDAENIIKRFVKN